MKKQLAIWLLINKSLEQGIPVMLLYVLASEGSSPGRQGFFMAVNANGEMEGSIGGGVMENKFVDLVKEKLKQDEFKVSIRKQIHNKSASKNQSGMICSGEQTILIYRVLTSESEHIKRIIFCIKEGNNGKLTLSPKGLFFDNLSPETDYIFFYKNDAEWFYEEKIGYKNFLHIIGSGHCALAFSALMSTMDFCVHLYDDRPDLPTYLNNAFVHKKIVLKDYNELKNLFPQGDNQYIVVMTVGYRTDDIVVRTLIDKKFKYFGVLGSKKKIEKMFSVYKDEGFDEALLKRIHAPVGLSINSQTPEEIAVSIAAQIIATKNG